MSEVMTIASHKGSYEVHFDPAALETIDRSVPEAAHFVVDARVAALYQRELAPVLDSCHAFLGMIDIQHGTC